MCIHFNHTRTIEQTGVKAGKRGMQLVRQRDRSKMVFGKAQQSMKISTGDLLWML